MAMLQPSEKPYWSSWNPHQIDNDKHGSPSRIARVPRDPYEFRETKAPAMPEDFVKARSIDMQVTTGPGARYVHLEMQPDYLDTMDAPFAVFTFLYRGKGFFGSASHSTDSHQRSGSTTPTVSSVESNDTKSIEYSEWQTRESDKDKVTKKTSDKEASASWEGEKNDPKLKDENPKQEKSKEQKSKEKTPNETGKQSLGDAAGTGGWATTEQENGKGKKVVW